MGNSYSRISPPTQREAQPSLTTTSAARPGFDSRSQQEEVLVESVFHSMLTLERRRAERSRKPFVLMLLDAIRKK